MQPNDAGGRANHYRVKPQPPPAWACGWPSALTARRVASIRRAKGLDAEDLGSGVYLWRETSTNRRTARVKKASTGFYSGPANHYEQYHNSHEHDLHEWLPLLYKYVSHAIRSLSKNAPRQVFLRNLSPLQTAAGYRDACCRSMIIAIARM